MHIFYFNYVSLRVCTGIDMSLQMLETANKHVDTFTKDVLRYNRPNMQFVQVRPITKIVLHVQLMLQIALSRAIWLRYQRSYFSAACRVLRKDTLKIKSQPQVCKNLPLLAFQWVWLCGCIVCDVALARALLTTYKQLASAMRARISS